MKLYKVTTICLQNKMKRYEAAWDVLGNNFVMRHILESPFYYYCINIWAYHGYSVSYIDLQIYYVGFIFLLSVF